MGEIFGRVPNKKDEILAKFLEPLTYHDYIIFQIDFTFMYYALIIQLKIEATKEETREIAKEHSGFKAQGP